MKKFYFLCGLPRAGNTLFSSIMNQNLKVTVTANSLVSDIFCGAELLKNHDVYENYPDEQSLDNITKNILPNYFSHWKADYIIDRSIWGFPTNFEILKKYAPNKIKIIVLVRDLKEILASFVRFSYTSKDNYISRNAQTLTERCDYIMMNSGSLHKWIQCVYNLIQPENRKYIHLIEYDDLVGNTKTEIEKVYEFLDIPKFDHSFTNLSQLINNGLKYNDSILGIGLHDVKSDKVEKSKYNIYDYLPQDVDQRYNTSKFW